MDRIRIIQATLEYLEPLSVLFDDYRQFYKQAPNYEQSKSFLEERIEKQESMIYLALNLSNEVLGFIQLYLSFSSIYCKRKWILNDLFVRENSRRLGIAKKLMNRAKKLAIETKTINIYLEVQVKNIDAQALYKKLGYHEETEHYSYMLDITT